MSCVSEIIIWTAFGHTFPVNIKEVGRFPRTGRVLVHNGMFTELVILHRIISLSKVSFHLSDHPINMPLCASTVPVLGRCWQHRTSTGPVLVTNGMFTGHNALRLILQTITKKILNEEVNTFETSECNFIIRFAQYAQTRSKMQPLLLEYGNVR